MCVYIYIYIYIYIYLLRRHVDSTTMSFRDFKDTVYPLFESDTLSLECVVVVVVAVVVVGVVVGVQLFSDSSKRGMSKQYPLTVLLESPSL